jgi:hypothetical protein
MSIKLYSFLEKKNRGGKMNTDLNVQTTLTSMSHRGFLLKDENGKAVRMILSKISLNEKKKS